MRLKIPAGRRVWFTPDTHYSHSNICRATSRWTGSQRLELVLRDHDTLEGMNSAIVDAINAAVGPDDVLFHLGDWSFGGADQVAAFRSRVACREVHLVRGNHDKHVDDPALFSGVYDYLELDLPACPPLVLFHYPIDHWNREKRGSVHLHGHIHSMPANRVTLPNRVDVGVEGRRSGSAYSPYSVQEALELAASVVIEGGPRDHHEQTGSVLRHRDDGPQPH